MFVKFTALRVNLNVSYLVGTRNTQRHVSTANGVKTALAPGFREP